MIREESCNGFVFKRKAPADAKPPKKRPRAKAAVAHTPGKKEPAGPLFRFEYSGDPGLAGAACKDKDRDECKKSVPAKSELLFKFSTHKPPRQSLKASTPSSAAKRDDGLGIAEDGAPAPRLSVDGKRRSSIFKTRRESLFSYEHVYNGVVNPCDFYKHSNESQSKGARIKQVLLWAIKYISTGNVAIDGLSAEGLSQACAPLIPRVIDRRLEFAAAPARREERENPINERAKGLLEKTRGEIEKYQQEIERWAAKRREVFCENKLFPPLGADAPAVARRSSIPHALSMRSSTQSFVSFEASSLVSPGSSAGKLSSLVSRKIEELRVSINSIRYYIFLSSEYTDRVYSTLFDAYCGTTSAEDADAHALLQVLCNFSRSLPAGTGKYLVK